jgi:hypothetical protein
MIRPQSVDQGLIDVEYHLLHQEKNRAVALVSQGVINTSSAQQILEQGEVRQTIRPGLIHIFTYLLTALA